MFRTAPRRAFLSVAAGAAIGLHESPEKKLSIYPSPTPDVLLVDSPLLLEGEIGALRRQAQGMYADAHAHVQGWVSKWIGVEHAVERRIKSIISPDEELTPGLLYTGVAGLSGSILVRNRFLPARLFVPPLFLVLSAQHFLPKTTGNLSAYLGSLEETYFPALAEKHDIAKAHSQMTWERIKDATKDGRQWVDHGAAVVIEKIQETTGLKLKETLGSRRAQVSEPIKAVAEAVSEHKVEAKVDEKEEDVKRLV